MNEVRTTVAIYQLLCNDPDEFPGCPGVNEVGSAPVREKCLSGRCIVMVQNLKLGKSMRVDRERIVGNTNNRLDSVSAQRFSDAKDVHCAIARKVAVRNKKNIHAEAIGTLFRRLSAEVCVSEVRIVVSVSSFNFILPKVLKKRRSESRLLLPDRFSHKFHPRARVA